VQNLEKYRHLKLKTGAILASDETIDLEAIELAPGESTGPRRHPDSDLVVLFYEGRGTVRTGDRSFAFGGLRQAYAPAGVTFEITNTGPTPLKIAYGLCPNGPTEVADVHPPKIQSGGVTMLGITQFDRFPDSGLVRGGMFFLEPGQEASYHSHDGAPEVFVFLQGQCDSTTEDEMVHVGPGDVIYVAPEMKHRLLNTGTDRLVVWLTVTPNVTPSHTFYEQQPDGLYKRITQRLDGKTSLPPSR